MWKPSGSQFANIGDTGCEGTELIILLHPHVLIFKVLLVMMITFWWLLTTKLLQVMHSAFCMSLEGTMEDAASMVVQKRAHRICVVNDKQELVGLISRGDIMRATMANFKVYMRAQEKQEAAVLKDSGSAIH